MTAALLLMLFGAADRPVAALKGGEIWLMREGMPPVQLTRDGCEKYREPVWSPGGTTIAYFTNTTQDKPWCHTEVVLLSADGTRLKAIPGLNRGNAVMRVEWLGNDRIGIDTHINPSLGEYRVVDVMTGREIASYSGGGFRPSPDHRRIAHSGPVPHFSPPVLKSGYLMVDHAVIYPPNAGSTPNARPPDPADPRLFRDIREFRSGFAWSPDGARIAFIEKLFDWRAEQLGSYYGTEENRRWRLVVVPSAGGAPVRTELPELLDGVVTVTWTSAGRVRIEGGGADGEYVAR